MHIWLDTINLDAIADGAAKGLIAGVTTNPSILSKSKNIPETLREILKLQDGPVAVQVTANHAAGMIEEGRAIYHFSKNMIVKVPVNSEGLIAINQLRKEYIPILATAVFNPIQALLAAKLGAGLVAPYFSHMGEHAKENLKSINAIMNKFNGGVLCASLKNIDDVLFCAQIGLEAVTIKENLFYLLVNDHDLVSKFMDKFAHDWTNAHGQVSIGDMLK